MTYQSKLDRHAIRNMDVVGVGFGPAAMAVACALEDAREAGIPAPGRFLFLEKAANSEWHPELLVPGTDINHSMLRDLVTPRNPRSRFSFAMYLHAHDRIYPFGVMGRPASRLEWSRYVCWVAQQLQSYVRYQDAVQEILPNLRDGRLDSLDVVSQSGVTRTRNLVLSTGSIPNIPEQFAAVSSPNLFHTSKYLSSVKAFNPLPGRWLVVGSGQSASESVSDLLRRGASEVHSLHRSLGFGLTQLSHFHADVFSPGHVDYFHGLNAVAQKKLFSEIKSTNYAGIDPDDSAALYSLIYEDEMVGAKRLRMHVNHVAKRITWDGASFTIGLEDRFSGAPRSLEVDGIVLATGYRQPAIPPLLAQLQPWLVTREDGRISVARDHRVELTDGSAPNIILNGLSEHAHGIASAQSFSLLALRAGTILQTLESRRPEPLLAMSAGA